METKMKLSEKYVVVTAIQQFRIKYCISLDELQKENPDMLVEPEWALDAVTCKDVKEFSQHDIGESIVDYRIMDCSEVINLFDKENDYLAGWDPEEKLKWINQYKENKNE